MNSGEPCGPNSSFLKYPRGGCQSSRGGCCPGTFPEVRVGRRALGTLSLLAEIVSISVADFVMLLLQLLEHIYGLYYRLLAINPCLKIHFSTGNLGGAQMYLRAGAMSTAPALRVWSIIFKPGYGSLYHLRLPYLRTGMSGMYGAEPLLGL